MRGSKIREEDDCTHDRILVCNLVVEERSGPCDGHGPCQSAAGFRYFCSPTHGCGAVHGRLGCIAQSTSVFAVRTSFFSLFQKKEPIFIKVDIFKISRLNVVHTSISAIIESFGITQTLL